MFTKKSVGSHIHLETQGKIVVNAYYMAPTMNTKNAETQSIPIKNWLPTGGYGGQGVSRSKHAPQCHHAAGYIY